MFNMNDIEDKQVINNDENVLETKKSLAAKSNQGYRNLQSTSETQEKNDSTPAVQEQDDEFPSICFKCELCNLNEKCEYFGKSPPWSTRTSLLEDAYIMRDPFSSLHRKQILILGAKCSLCNIDVCVGNRCSLFYSKRFCKDCVVKNATYFPVQIQMKIKKIFS